MSPEAFARVAFNAVLTNPKILDCEPQSLRRAVLECAQRGLLPDGDSAAIIPRKGKATFQIGYKGMCDLARRAIPGCGIRTQVVTNKDEWVYKEGLTMVLDHERDPMTWPDESNVIAAYAVVEMPSGVKESEVMLRCDIDHIRKNYAHASSEAWAKEFAEQCKKTVLRRLGKRLPIRSGLLTAAEPVVPLTDPSMRKRSKTPSRSATLSQTATLILPLRLRKPGRRESRESASRDRLSGQPRSLSVIRIRNRSRNRHRGRIRKASQTQGSRVEPTPLDRS